MSAAFVLVTTSFPIKGDGSEAAGSFVADLVEELAKHVPVRVVAPGPKAVREQWSSNIEIHRYAAPSRPLSTLRPWRPGDLAWLVQVLRGGMRATRSATAEGACHILALWGLPCGEWARRVASEIKIDYSVWMLGSDIWSLGKFPILRTIIKRVICQAQKAYADGILLGQDARLISGRNIEFLPSTRNICLKNPPQPRGNPPYRLLFLGRWHRNKGIDLLLDALSLLNEEDWTTIESIEIQGGGPMRELVQQRVRQLQDHSRPVKIGSFLSKGEAEQAIARNDWVLIPSRIESIPVIFSDAVKLGRPVVATPVGDFPAIMQAAAGFCGVLSSSTDAYDYAIAIRTALRTPSTLFAERLKSMADRFNLNSSVRQLLGGYQSE